jgi:hypothetical protein
VQSRLHEIPDQEIVEDFVIDRRHQAVAGKLEVMPRPFLPSSETKLARPPVFGVEDVALAVGRDTVAQSPAAEIGGVLVAEPRIGRKDRFVVLGNERRIARGRNAKHGISAIADPRSPSCPKLANTRLRQS